MKARCFSFVTMQPPITHMHTHNHACTYETLSGIRGVVPEGILWGGEWGKKTERWMCREHGQRRKETITGISYREQTGISGSCVSCCYVLSDLKSLVWWLCCKENNILKIHKKSTTHRDTHTLNLPLFKELFQKKT